MEPIPNLNTLRTLYLILIHKNLKKGSDDCFRKPPLYPILIDGGRHPPPPGRVAHPITTFLILFL